MAEGFSLWDRSAVEARVAPESAGDIETDVAIVGGGFSGLSTALHLAEAGVEAHVLEGEAIGFGGSGRNVGLVNPGVWLPPLEVRKALGDARGGAFLELFGEAPGYVFTLIERHQMRAEATRTGTIHAAHAPSGMKDLQGRYDEWARMGAPVELLDKAGARTKTGSDAFHGGLLDNRAGTVNPMGYARGLARAATAAGAKVTTGAKVESLVRDGGRWRLGLAGGGDVLADRVVLATNAYSDDLWPGLTSVLTPIHYFQVATEPLGERSKGVLPEGQGLWDTARVMFSLRRDAYGRVILGSMGKVIGGDKGLTHTWAKRTLKRLYPGLGDAAWEPAWHGRIGMTPDHLPRILNPSEKLYALIGYNGRGITTGTVLGRALAHYLAGGPESALPLPLSQPQAAPFRGPMAAFYEAAFKAYRVYKTI